VVVEGPTRIDLVRNPEAIGDDVWRDEARDRAQLVTGISRLEQRLSLEEGMVHRSVLQRDAILYHATIITGPQGTVFGLTDDQPSALEKLWRGYGDYGLPQCADSATEGRRVLGSQLMRERSRTQRERKCAEVRRKHGMPRCAWCGFGASSRYPVSLAESIFDAHHLVPPAESATPKLTALADLVVLCANCHRAVHATRAVEANYSALASHIQRRR